MEKSKTRKAHKKSRNGCLPCKSRHVKCDEQKPSCANCVKQGTVCGYRSSRYQDAATRSPLTTYTPSSTEGTVFDQALPEQNLVASGPDLTLNTIQLRLLHHYTTVTAKTLAYDQGSEEVFSTHLVLTAFNHAYLLHSVLSVAALHLARLHAVTGSPDPEYSLLADLHHDAALSDFRATVSNIDETNWKPVLMFAGALFPYSTTASISESNNLEHAFSNFLTNIALTRKVRPMVTGFYEELRGSELGQMIPDDVKEINWETKEAPVHTELMQLRKFAEVVHHLYPPDIVDAYGYAIHILELSFEAAAKSRRPPSDALLKIWIHFIPDRYIGLLSERQPGSLIILAHYAVLLRRSEHYWYLKGVAEQVLSIADSFVPSEWNSWLEWPKAQIRGSPNTTMPG